MSTQHDSKSRVILMADDDEDDRLLTAEAIQKSGLKGAIRFFPDGAALMEYLRDPAAGGDTTGLENEIILLDINMPRMSGLEFLKTVKADSAFNEIPVVIISTEGKEEDTIRGLEAGAAAYIKKPFGNQELLEVIQRL